MAKSRKLPSNYRRLEQEIGGNVVDAIELSPRSSGRLALPGSYSGDNPHPRHDVRIDATGPGVTHEQTFLGSAENYHVVYEVHNFRDSLSFARIELAAD